MRNYLLLLFLLAAPFLSKAQKTITLSKDTTTYDATNIERRPEFPGGSDKFNEFLAQTLKYPAEAVENKLQGDVELSFMVSADGSLSDIKVAKSRAEVLDKEALRIISLSPKWIPAKKDGKAIDCAATASVSFRLK